MDASVAIVTGASRGIGRAICAQLVHAGVRTLLVARDAERLQQCAAELPGAAERAVCATDLRAADAADVVLETCHRTLGAPSVLINNAGTAPTAPFARTDDALLDETLDLHVRAPLRLLRAALPALRASGRGVAVQLASTAGLRGFAYTAAYTAAKHALVGLTRALAAECAGDDTIRSYAVCPGFVDTGVTRAAARALAARGDGDVGAALARLGGMNRIGRLHAAGEVASHTVRLCRERPTGGIVLDLDRDPPAFLDAP